MFEKIEIRFLYIRFAATENATKYMHLNREQETQSWQTARRVQRSVKVIKYVTIPYDRCGFLLVSY